MLLLLFHLSYYCARVRYSIWWFFRFLHSLTRECNESQTIIIKPAHIPATSRSSSSSSTVKSHANISATTPKQCKRDATQTDEDSPKKCVTISCISLWILRRYLSLCFTLCTCAVNPLNPMFHLHKINEFQLILRYGQTKLEISSSASFDVMNTHIFNCRTNRISLAQWCCVLHSIRVVFFLLFIHRSFPPHSFSLI